MTRIKGDEGELDALATYLEAVQVFLHQHMHSRNGALLQHQLSPTCATVSFTPSEAGPKAPKWPRAAVAEADSTDRQIRGTCIENLAQSSPASENSRPKSKRAGF